MASETHMTTRVIIHAPEPDALTRARSNARNLLAAVPEAEIEIVVNAGGVSALLAAGPSDPATDPLIRVCANTLARLDRAAPDGVAVVPVAIAHLVARQAEGWAYVRA